MNTKQKEKKVYYQALDLEAVNNTDICGIGMSVIDENGILVYKNEWWIKLRKAVVIDPRCKTEFWDKNPTVWNHMQENGEPECTQIEDFVKEFDNVHQLFGINQKDLKLVCDNPEFDFGRLNPYVRAICNREPLRYTTTGEYRPIKDLGDVVWSLGIGQVIDDAANKVVKHDHFPANDAHHNLICHIIQERTLARIKEHFSEQFVKIATDVSEGVVGHILNKMVESVYNIYIKRLL